MDKYAGENLDLMREPQWQLLSTSFFPNKALSKLYSLKKIILEADPDILMLVEVGGRQSLENFNRYFLDDRYEVQFGESNSDRGIDVGYLCKKELADTHFYLINHSSTKLRNGRRFARGLLELRIMRQGKLSATLLLTHLKSKLDMRKEDFEGRGLRGAEVEFIVKHLKKLLIAHPKSPALVCGDLNGIIYKDHTEEELQPFLDAGLEDVFEHANLPLEQRHTYYFFNKQHQRIPMQLDYILVPKKFGNIVADCKVLDMEPELVPHPPESLAQKRLLPSDHYPVFCALELP